MKKMFFLLFAVSATLGVFAQDQTPQELARSFMMKGDWNNAILVLNKALQGAADLSAA